MITSSCRVSLSRIVKGVHKDKCALKASRNTFRGWFGGAALNVRKKKKKRKQGLYIERVTDKKKTKISDPTKPLNRGSWGGASEKTRNSQCVVQN